MTTCDMQPQRDGASYAHGTDSASPGGRINVTLKCSRCNVCSVQWPLSEAPWHWASTSDEAMVPLQAALQGAIIAICENVKHCLASSCQNSLGKVNQAAQMNGAGRLEASTQSEEPAPATPDFAVGGSKAAELPVRSPSRSSLTPMADVNGASRPTGAQESRQKLGKETDADWKLVGTKEQEEHLRRAFSEAKAHDADNKPQEWDHPTKDDQQPPSATWQAAENRSRALGDNKRAQKAAARFKAQEEEKLLEDARLLAEREAAEQRPLAFKPRCCQKAMKLITVKAGARSCPCRAPEGTATFDCADCFMTYCGRCAPREMAKVLDKFKEDPLLMTTWRLLNEEDEDHGANRIGWKCTPATADDTWHDDAT